jgi:beta-ribofuranosylaminobenzene 5'-phosphate synthase
LIIKTPSRLHLTLIDLNGKYGRIDGGVGLTLKRPRLTLEAQPNAGDVQIHFSQQSTLNQEMRDDYCKKIDAVSQKITEFLHFKGESLKGGYNFKIGENFPSHSGLGSGTQLSLAVAKLILNMNDQDLPAREIAKIVGRGGTSGIGLASFDQGGFIVDSGHKTSEKDSFLPSSASKASPPPVIARYDFPEDWKIILAIPNVDRRVSGNIEVDIFQKYCPIPLPEVQELSHLLLMQMMPAVVEEDLDAFGLAVNHIQEVGFKKVELKLQNPFIKNFMDNLRSAGASGVGMSSFGPTIYAVTDTNTQEIFKTAKKQLKECGGEIIISEAQNSGAVIRD